ncbi:HAMP domain-containing protein [Phenylobacterium montanum]|uniref:histidine kinase n=2 Tax=Phenylobacterium montanum TaxID=2823693 RepID=A0A975G5C8_9CAUL|nr:HAMP domain-containing protein [Caulobacter sp. S6]
MQVAVTWAFFNAQWQEVNTRLSEGLAGDIAWVVETYQSDPSPPALTKLTNEAERSLGLSVKLYEGRTLPTGNRASLISPGDRALKAALSDRLDQPFWFDSTRYPADLDIRVQVTAGVLRVIAPRDRAMTTKSNIFILWMTGATVLLTGVAILFIRNQVRSIERLADAADAFGRGGDVPQFKPHGAREVRKAAQAFIAMKERIQRHIDQRTALLASVSHDLRTPLTRLKLEAALAEPSKRVDAIKRDLSEMEHMIDEYLAFARGQGGEAVEETSLRELIEVVADGAERGGASLSLEIEPDLIAKLRPNVFKRALSNLIMNAAAHGEEVVVAARARSGGGVEITVDDDGPGIPPDRYEEAFKPFNRLDEARNQNEKGVGLGLAIARDVVRGLGGDLTLDRSPLGGLRAIIRLPG